MWFLIILFLIIGAVAVLVRSTKTLLVLAGVFSLIAMFYTPWWPIIFFLLSGVGVIIYLDNKDKKEERQKEFKDSLARDIQQEVEIGDLINRMEKRGRK